LLAGLGVVAAAAVAINSNEGTERAQASARTPVAGWKRPADVGTFVFYLIDNEEQRDAILRLRGEMEHELISEKGYVPTERFVFLFARTPSEEQRAYDFIENTLSVPGGADVKVGDLRPGPAPLPYELRGEPLGLGKGSRSGAKSEIESRLRRVLTNGALLAGISPRPGIKPR
jgi:hypothetical protein